MNIQENLENLKNIKKILEDYINGVSEITDEKYEFILTHYLNITLQDKEKIEEILKKHKILKKNNTQQHFSFIKKIKKFFHIDEIKEHLIKKINIEEKIAIQPKIDGMFVNLIYCDGILIRSITRGDCVGGESVLKAVQQIKSIPKRLYGDEFDKKIVEIRGEIFIPRSIFYKYLSESFVTARNALIGMLAKIETDEYKYMEFIAYDFGFINVLQQKQDYYESLEKLKKIGFETIPCKYKTIEELIEEIKIISKEFDCLNYDTDGIIVRINDFQKIKESIYSDKIISGHCFAVKKTISFVGKIIEITASVNKTGVITPIATIEQINFRGAKYNKVSLYSYGLYEREKIAKGDEITLLLNTLIVYKNIHKKKGTFIPIENCPCCGYKTSIVGMHMYCFSLQCKAQISGKINEFLEANGYKGFSIKTINVLIENNVIQQVEDMLRINERLRNKEIKGFGPQKTKKIIEISEDIFNNLKEIQAIQFLCIPQIGPKSTQKLAEEIKKDPKILINCNLQNLTFLNTLQKKYLEIFFENEDNRKNFRILLKIVNDRNRG